MSRVACETFVTTGPGRRRRRDHDQRLRRHPQGRPRDDQRDRLQPRVLRLRRQHLSACWCRSTSSRPTSPRASTTPRRCARHVGRGPAQQAGRRRPGDDVRLRLRRDRRRSCRCRSGWPTAWPSAWPRCARPATRARTCAPTARPRSPSTTRTASRSGCAPCSSRPSTTTASTATSVIRPDLIEHVIRPVVPGAVRRRRLRGLRQPDRHVRASAARTATPASPAARSSSTPTAAWPATAAAPSRARTRPRSTARPPTPPAGWPRTWWPSGAASRCEVQVAYAIGVARPVSLLVETFGTETVDPAKIVEGRRRGLRPAPGGHHPRPRPAPADLQADRRLRALRSAADDGGFTWERTDKVDDLQARRSGSDPALDPGLPSRRAGAPARAG